jgi:hypothetical protein
MNPTITNSRLERERRLDPLRFQREYEAEFTDDLSACFEYGALQACVDGGVHERPPVPRVQYRAFFDPASGEKKGNDAFTLGIAHRDNGRAVLDVLRAWAPPFSPSTVIAEIADLLRRYRLQKISGDRYSPGFVSEGFRMHGIRYEPSPFDRSQLYLEVLNGMNSAAVVFLDDRGLLRELRGFERRRGSNGGRDRVDHGPHAHDDRANAAAGAVVLAMQAPRAMDPKLIRFCLQAGAVDADHPDPLYARRFF